MAEISQKTWKLKEKCLSLQRQSPPRFPSEQRTRVELFLFIATMKYNKQPLDIPAQIAMLKGRGQNIADENLVQKVKQACKMIVGVTSVKVQRPAKKKVYDITKTKAFQEALDDVKHGRVTQYDSVDDLFNKLGIKV